MSLVAALILAASATAPQAGSDQPSGAQAVTATASARIVRSVSIRQGETPRPEGPQAEVKRNRDGRVIVEFF